MSDRPDWQTIDRFLAGEATPEDLRAIDAWRSAAPGNDALLRTLRQGGTDAAAWDADAAWTRVTARVRRDVLPLRAQAREPARRPRRVPWRAAAAMLLAAAGVATWRETTRRRAASADAPVAMSTVVAPAEGRTSVTLPDGSRVTLHAGSRLRHAATLGGASGPRDVFLDGEGYFEVTHDALRPFRVHARHALAQDLGTRFVVRASTASPTVEVVVAEGLVSLHRRDARDSALVRPGERARLGATGEAVVQPVPDVGAYTEWASGTLALQDVTLADAMPRLARWYDVDVVLADRQLATRRVVARFHDAPLAQVLDALALALDARWERSGRTVTLHAARPR
ncbi:FecR family protein [Roseisolibacter agri]|uniref:Fec operon regulator FecR n=1 Tax=Roseisolibacter agri TaxID=2014610 RepID=A0AA37QJV4_9BACT|nr:FecR domain-containing protein [Roseisolibacter agri]GLC27143.1 hypothetical protein rosag_36560 [Roseisolibacter agri]